jgi:hypothetical protein
VPLSAPTPQEIFHLAQDHINRVLNKVLTQYRLEVLTFGARREQAVLAFLDRRRQPTSVALRSSPWYLSLRQDVQAVPEKSGYVLNTLQYAYRIQRTPSVRDEAEVRFEYVSPAIDPDFPYSRHHVQFHREFQDVRGGFSPNTLHIPTGGVTIEQVIRFLIADLGVPPLVSNWDDELRKSEEQSWAWMSAVSSPLPFFVVERRVSLPVREEPFRLRSRDLYRDGRRVTSQ